MDNRTVRTTIEFLELLRELYKPLSQDGKSPASDYRIAKQLGVSQQAVSGWRTGRSHFDDGTAIKVADELGLHREYVLGCMHLQRASTGELRELWTDIALRNAHLVVLGVAVLSAMTKGDFS